MTHPTQKYVNRLETPSVVHGFPTATSDVSTGIIRNANGGAPVEHMANSPVPSLIATFTSIDVPVPQCATPATNCGTLRPRDQLKS